MKQTMRSCGRQRMVKQPKKGEGLKKDDAQDRALTNEKSAPAIPTKWQ